MAQHEWTAYCEDGEHSVKIPPQKELIQEHFGKSPEKAKMREPKYSPLRIPRAVVVGTVVYMDVKQVRRFPIANPAMAIHVLPNVEVFVALGLIA